MPSSADLTQILTAEMHVTLPQENDEAILVLMKLYCQITWAVLVLAFLRWLLYRGPAHRKLRHHLQMQAIASSPFSKLPSELRAIIYRFTLVSDQAIYIPVQHAWTEPALLTTCHLFRMEARNMYYYENRFFVSYTDFGSDRDFEFPKRIHARGLRAMHLSVDERQVFSSLQRRSWRNLKLWLCRVHRNKIVYVPALDWLPDVKNKDPDTMVRVMFRIVVEMRGADWAMVERVLAVQFPILAAHDERWKVERYVGYVAKTK